MCNGMEKAWYYHTWFFHKDIGEEGGFELDFINKTQWMPSLKFKQYLIFIPLTWVVTTFIEVMLNPELDYWLLTITLFQIIEMIWYAACVFLVPEHTRATLVWYYLSLTFTQSVWPVMLSIKNVMCDRDYHGYITERTCANTGQHELFYVYMYLASFYSIVISEGSIALQSLVILLLYLPSTVIGAFYTKATLLQYFNTNTFLYGTYVSIHGIGLVFYETKRQRYTLTLDLQKEMTLRQRTVSYMFHELRNPLNVITLATDQTEDKHLQETLNPCLFIMENILTDALDFQKISQGSFTLHSMSFNFHEMLLQTISSAEPLWRAKKQTFVLELNDMAKTLKHKVIGDQMRIRQIILNYVSNAVKYNDPLGQVVMTVELDNGPDNEITKELTKELTKDSLSFTIKVTDSGVGITDEDQKLLFQPFVQISNRLSAVTKGTGLGLTIVASLVSQMHGTYGVTSTLGVGSTFHCTIPLKLTTELVRQDHGDGEDQHDGGELLLMGPILIVDDNEMVCSIIKTILQKRGIEAEIAHNGQAAIDMLTRDGAKYKVILMDDMMPVMSGKEAIAIIRNELRLTVPIIGITGNVDAKETFRELGANDVLIKPINKNELFDVVSRYSTVSPEGRGTAQTS